MDYITRDENSQKVYLSENTLDVDDILKNNYPYIYEAIKKENHILKSHSCNLFKELIFECKVIGFCSYDHSREFITAAINNVYILPEFRGNGIFKAELEKTLKKHSKPSIVEPTRAIVELLVKYGYARKVENIVASAIEFIIPGEHVISNKEYDSSEELSTHFYDLNACCAIHFLDLKSEYLAYSMPLNSDIINYEIKDINIDELKNSFVKHDNFKKIIKELEDNLEVITYNLEDIIGDDENLSPYIESLIDDAHVTYSDAIAIKEQIKEEYSEGKVLNESLLIRLAYLFEKKKEATIKSHSQTCPECDMPIDPHDKYCHFCGISLE